MWCGTINITPLKVGLESVKCFDGVHIIYLIVPTSETNTTNNYMVGDNMDCVHIIFLNLIVTTLNTIATKSYMVGVRIETTKNNVNNMNCVHIIF